MPTCSQPKCTITTTGVCLEGHKQGCPHLVADTAAPREASAEASTTTPIQPTTPDLYHFYSGEKLTAAEASQIMSSRPVRMVLCAGPKDAGKTTFLAAIGEMFRKGSFASFRFAGSKTLCAFERVTWLATIASGAGKPDTKRSHRGEKDTFFHLQVQRVGCAEKRIDLMIADLPGEIFPDVLSTKEVCEEQLALARADHLVLFVDCGSIIDNARRHSEKDMAIRFLSQVRKCRHNPTSVQVTVVFSRWDKVTASGNGQDHEEYCNLVEHDIRERFETVFGGLRFDRIAARPDSGAPPTNTAIQQLFGHWLEEGPLLPFVTVSRNLKPARDFCGFGLE